jgi:hypothetical protein
VKKCNRCGIVKSYSEFYKDRYRKDGYDSYCRECNKEIYREWVARNPEHARQKWREASKKYDEPGRRRKRKYGLPHGRYEEMVKEQDNKCLICKKELPLFVDHDHKTGIVRGLLCHHCNAGIGYLKDNTALLKSAITYLAGYKFR